MALEGKEHSKNKEDLIKDAEKIIQNWANLETIILTISIGQYRQRLFPAHYQMTV